MSEVIHDPLVPPPVALDHDHGRARESGAAGDVAVNEQRYILRGGAVRDNLCARIHEIPETPPMEVVIRPYKSKRSLEQNAKMWTLIRAIAQGDELEVTKDRLLMKWAGWEVRSLPDGTEYPVPAVGGSSRLTVEQMSEFIDWLEVFAAEWGVHVQAA